MLGFLFFVVVICKINCWNWINNFVNNVYIRKLNFCEDLIWWCEELIIINWGI